MNGRNGQSRPDSDSSPEVRPEARPAAVAAVEGLARLLSLAAIYPASHTRVKELVGPVLEALRAGCGPEGGLPLEVTADALVVGGGTVPERGPGLSRLRQDLDRLGVTSLVLRREMTGDDLLQFARTLRQRATPASGSAELAHLELAGLPSTVAVIQRDFGEPTFDETEAPVRRGDPKARGNGVVGPGGASNAGSPGDPRTQRELRLLVKQVLRERLASEGREGSGGAAAPGLANRREIVRAVGESLRRALDRRVAPGRERTVAVLLRDAERTLPSVADGIPVEPVLDALRASIDEHLRDSFLSDLAAVFELGTPVSREGIEYELTLKELARGIEAFVESAPPFAEEAGARALEHLCVFLCLLARAEGTPVRSSLGARLATALESVPPEGAREALLAWLRGLVESEDHTTLDAVFPIAATVLRRRAPGLPGDLLRAASKPARASVLMALWPHLLAELLVAGPEAVRAEEAEVVALLSRLTSGTLRVGLPRLAALPSVRAGGFSRRLFLPPRPELHSLYAALLELPEPAEIPVLVFEAFTRFPPKHPAAAALSVLKNPDARARAFLGRLLAELGGEETGADLVPEAARILVAALKAVPPSGRDAPWVPRAILGLRTLPTPDSTALLREIRAARRFLVLPRWPNACRRAAGPAAAAPGAAPRPALGAAE